MIKRGYRLTSIAVILLLIMSFSTLALSVSLAADQTTGDEPLTVEFTCSVSDGNATYDYYIDFDDGSDSTSSSSSSDTYVKTHDYDEGDYTATCEVTDSNNDTDNDTKSISATSSTIESISVTNDLITNGNEVGDIITFEVTIENNGTADLSEVDLEFAFDDDLLQFDDTDESGYSEHSNDIEWDDLGPLDAGDSIVIEIDFEALETGTAETDAIVTVDGSTAADSQEKTVTITNEDDEDPVILIIQPKDEYYTLNEEITFKWNVTDNIDEELECNLTVDGEVVKDEIMVDNGTTETREVDLDDGEHDWKLTCWDDSLNIEKTTSRTIYVGQGDPDLANYVFDLDESDIVTNIMEEDSSAVITINDTAYIITLLEVYATSVQIEIPSMGDTVFLQKGKTLTLDLNLDDEDDANITLDSLEAALTAEITVTTLNAKAPFIEIPDFLNDTNVTDNATDVFNDTDRVPIVIDYTEDTPEQETGEEGVLADILASEEYEQFDADEYDTGVTSVTEDVTRVIKENPWYLALVGALILLIIIVIVVVKIVKAPHHGVTEPMSGPGVPNKMLRYIEKSLQDGVYKGEIESSLVKSGWSESEINRALLFVRMKIDIKNKMKPEFIRSDLLAQGWSQDQIREAFTYFNVKMNLDKDIPMDKVQDALVDKGVPHHEINRAILYNKVMNKDNELETDALKKVLRTKGWSKDQVKRALFYAYVKNLLNEGLTMGHIEEELLKEGKDRGEIKQMIKSLKKKL